MQRCISPGWHETLFYSFYKCHKCLTANRSILFTSFPNFLNTYIVYQYTPPVLHGLFQFRTTRVWGDLFMFPLPPNIPQIPPLGAPQSILCLPNQGVSRVFHPDIAFVSICLLVWHMPSCLVNAACIVFYWCRHRFHYTAHNSSASCTMTKWC